MRSFKQYLLEDSAGVQLTTSKEIKALIKKYPSIVSTGSISVNGDGTVAVTSYNKKFYWGKAQAEKTNLSETVLPFQFTTFEGNFDVISDSIISTAGFPTGSGYIDLKLNAIESLQGFTGQFTDVAIRCPKLNHFDCKVKTDYVFISMIESFNVKDFAKSFSAGPRGFIAINFGLSAAEQLLYRKPLLSLLKLKNFDGIDFVGSQGTSNKKLIEIKKVCDIINKYSGKNDILSAQEELMDNGLEEYAQL